MKNTKQFYFQNGLSVVLQGLGAMLGEGTEHKEPDKDYFWEIVSNFLCTNQSGTVWNSSSYFDGVNHEGCYLAYVRHMFGRMPYILTKYKYDVQWKMWTQIRTRTLNVYKYKDYYYYSPDSTVVNEDVKTKNQFNSLDELLNAFYNE